MGVLAHHSRGLHGVADDHDDAAFVVVEDSRRGALQELTVRAERWAERHVDAPRNMASAEAGIRGVKEDGAGPETSVKGWILAELRVLLTSNVRPVESRNGDLPWFTPQRVFI